MGKKKFIDKKKSATFQLLARDSSDPNYDVGPSGDRVFVRVDNNQYSIDGFSDDRGHVEGSTFADAPDDYGDEDEAGTAFSGVQAGDKSGSLPEHIRREILELGFPDDGYNYLTHLREIKNVGAGSSYYENPKARLDQLPRDVKAYDASKVEIANFQNNSSANPVYSVASKTVGVRIEKAVDPEVAALLEDSDMSEPESEVDELEEDFVVKANYLEGSIDGQLDMKLMVVEESHVNDIVNHGSGTVHREKNFVDDLGANNEKPRTRRLLDEQFDLLELQEYGTDSEDEYNDYMGEEDECQESLAEKLNHAFRDQPLDGFDLSGKFKSPSDLFDGKSGEEDKEELDADPDVISRCRELAEKYQIENEDEVVVLEESSSDSEVWDCETIVSTYSNLDNHPGKIGAPETRRKKKVLPTVPESSSASSHVISLRGKAKLPVEYLPQSRKHSVVENVKDMNKPTMENQKKKQHGQESKEEKKERKAAVKEERREARRMKKEMKGLYKSEAQRAQKVAAFAGPSSIHLM